MAKKKSKTPEIRPLGGKILVERVEAESMTKGGIVLPDSAQEKPRRGTILAIGDGRMLDDGTRAEFQVGVGDTVLFTSYGGTEIKFDGQEYLLMEESDVLAILT